MFVHADIGRGIPDEPLKSREVPSQPNPKSHVASIPGPPCFEDLSIRVTERGFAHLAHLEPLLELLVRLDQGPSRTAVVCSGEAGLPDVYARSPTFYEPLDSPVWPA